MEAADALKQKLEEEQRQRRRKMEEEGKEWQTQWFHKAHDPVLDESVWQFNGQYWISRQNATYNNPIRLW